MRQKVCYLYYYSCFGCFIDDFHLVEETKTYQETNEFYKQFAWDKNKYWAENPKDLIENYIYLYHLNQYIILPDYPEELND